MGNLSTNLSRHEFACKCDCGMDTVDYALVMVLQQTVDYFERELEFRVRITITSGNRCLDHNEAVQKKYNPSYIPYTSKTKHLLSKAADFQLHYFDNGWKLIDPEDIYAYLDTEYSDTFGLGLYNNRIHLDVRKFKGRWNG